MADAMTAQECHDRQTACAARVDAKIDTLREVIQRTEVLVAKIAGHLGINGSSTPHPHHRDGEAEERQHRRAEDVIAAAEAMVAAQKAAPAKKGLKDEMVENWRLLFVAVLAALAGEKVLSQIPALIKAAAGQ